MKKLFLTALIASTLVFTGCFKDDDTPIIIEEITIINDGGGSSSGAEVVAVTGIISSDVTWTNDKIYELNQKVVVESGVTLTINPGTIIKGKPGTGSLASALIIARGAKINAVGTASQPIIFTSSSDNIEVGETAGTNLSEANRGLWGGILVLGYAPCSLKGDLTETQIEGIPADDTFGLYGGDNINDNSGTIQYVSIRHGGALIGEGNEINGLTLGGVGAGTTIDHVEVIANVDDGIEFFGGNVNASNLLVWAQGDDALDIDQGYSGTITNAVVVLGDVSDHALEIDGREGSEATLSADFDGKFTINDLTLIGNSTTSGGEYADYRSLATGATNNVYAKGFPAGKDVELDNNAVSQNFLDGNLTFSAWEVVGFDNSIFVEKGGCIQNCDDDDSSNDVFEDLIIENDDFTTRAAAWTSQVTEGAQTVGADTSVLSWTYAATAGGLVF
ncbi:membrane protein [Tamlana nanhaiensis]|uniref:Membrane protein n=1 Tax=Neotamlana nanhaiensis TaxID=1382798 RepID=A0A0D7VZB3_9FLAO|nr:hypothetical protein [Tamlana nanhaiensis]KJD31758.1 membrane protein [Tamlana nanhaiensis]